MPDSGPDTITLSWCKPGEWYTSNRRGRCYKGQADENGNATLHRLPDGDDTKH